VSAVTDGEDGSLDRFPSLAEKGSPLQRSSGRRNSTRFDALVEVPAVKVPLKQKRQRMALPFCESPGWPRLL
jgi:hypothetical protein